MRVQQTSAPYARNANDTTYPSGQVWPLQSGLDGNVVESPRASEVHQQASLLKQESGQNVRASAFRIITPQRQNKLWDACPTPVCPDFLAILRPLPRAQDQADQQRQQVNVGFNLPQSNGQNKTQKNGQNQTLISKQNQTHNRDMTRDIRPEFRILKVAARKLDVFSESMNID